VCDLSRRLTGKITGSAYWITRFWSCSSTTFRETGYALFPIML